MIEVTETEDAQGIQIRGGAGPFHAAAIVAVIDHVITSEAKARSRLPDANQPSAWVRAARPRRPDDPLDIVYPDHRGDPL